MRINNENKMELPGKEAMYIPFTIQMQDSIEERNVHMNGQSGFWEERKWWFFTLEINTNVSLPGNVV